MTKINPLINLAIVRLTSPESTKSALQEITVECNSRISAAIQKIRISKTHPRVKVTRNAYYLTLSLKEEN